MRVTLGRGLAAVIAMVFAAPLGAQEVAPMRMQGEGPPAVCTATVIPDGPLAPWAQQADMQAQGDPAKLAGTSIKVGQAVRLALLPTPDVHFPLRPEKPGGSVSHGGLVGIYVGKAGKYRIALGSGAWIDLIGGGKTQVSIAHGHGPDCTGIRKMVDFDLKAGRYTLQISANAEPHTSLLIVPL